MNKLIKHIILLSVLSVSVFAQSSITYDPGTNIDVQTGADICADAIIINGTYSGGGTICSGVLPVTLISFEASVTKNIVKLVWITENEINNSGFDIERTKITQNGIDVWKKIGFIKGNGTVNGQSIYTYQDLRLQSATYKYRLKQLDYNGNFEYFGLNNDVSVNKPGSFSVSQNYPNPSNPKCKIDYELPSDAKVTIKVYDLIGREVATLVNETKQAGYYTAEFDGTNLASGIYIYRIKTDSFTGTKKLVLLK